MTYRTHKQGRTNRTYKQGMVTPCLTLRAEQIIATYAAGHQAKHVAIAFGVSVATIKTSIRDSTAILRIAGYNIRSRIDLAKIYGY